MFYECQVLASKSSHLLNFHDDFTSLEAAAKVLICLPSIALQTFDPHVAKSSVYTDTIEVLGRRNASHCQRVRES